LSETIETTETVTKPRRLKTSLFFPFLRMVRAMDGPKLFKEITAMQAKGKKLEKEAGDDDETIAEAKNEMGMELFGVVLDVLPDAEEETMDFLTRFTGLSRAELDEQDLEVTIGQVIEVFQDARFMDFLRSAVKGIRPGS